MRDIEGVVFEGQGWRSRPPGSARFDAFRPAQPCAPSRSGIPRYRCRSIRPARLPSRGPPKWFRDRSRGPAPAFPVGEGAEDARRSAPCFFAGATLETLRCIPSCRCGWWYRSTGTVPFLSPSFAIPVARSRRYHGRRLRSMQAPAHVLQPWRGFGSSIDRERARAAGGFVLACSICRAGGLSVRAGAALGDEFPDRKADNRWNVVQVASAHGILTHESGRLPALLRRVIPPPGTASPSRAQAKARAVPTAGSCRHNRPSGR